MRASIALVAVVMSAGAAMAQTEAGWVLDVQADCRAWYPTRLIDAAVRWSGKCRSGRAEGAGTLEIILGDKVVERYEGPMHDGAAEGRGKQEWIDGTRYVGMFSGGAPSGRGVTSFPNGGVYDGEHRSGQPHGKGLYTWRSGARYDGEFAEGRPHGRGSYTVPTANIPGTSGAGTYSGPWSKGCFRDGLRWAAIGVTPRDCGFDIERK